MLIGYARVSTQDQTLDLQADALRRAGCEQLFTDTTSGATAERPGLAEALSHLRPGDMLVFVPWIDSAARSSTSSPPTLSSASGGSVSRACKNTSSRRHPGGTLIFHFFGALAEFEREVIRERTVAGLQVARARERRGGRPSLQWFDPQKVVLARKR
jgi:DNA invertase Pin-like site-specific DNA recombinase